MRIFYLYYIIYKTTNLINGKYYIGQHKTNDVDDGYMGSGKWLKNAIKKHGPSNFITEILYIFDNERSMDLAERILVVPDLETNYNLIRGGNNGINSLTETKKEWVRLGRIKANENGAQEKAQQRLAELRNDIAWENSRIDKFRKTKMKTGSIMEPYWVTNGTVNKKIKSKNIPEGFWIGKVIKANPSKKSCYCKICSTEIPLRREFCDDCREIHTRTVKPKPPAQQLTGRSYYTNGIKDVLLTSEQPIPEGFVKGRTNGLRYKK